jgi:CRP-like cAMP-binding protein
MIFSEGESSKNFYRVLEGATRSFRILMDGRRHIAGFSFGGDFLGLDLQDEHVLSEDAVTDVALISYSRKQIERLAESEPAVHKYIVKTLVKGLAESQSRLVMLGQQTAEERLAWFLVRKAARLAEGHGVVNLPMGRQDIANYLGLTIETVSRVFTRLKRKRLIDVPNFHQVKILNGSMLQSLAEGSRHAA